MPTRAGMALGGMPDVEDLLPQWGGGFVLAGYTAVLAAVALATTVRRDVT